MELEDGETLSQTLRAPGGKVKANHSVDVESEIKGTTRIFQRASQGVNT